MIHFLYHDSNSRVLFPIKAQEEAAAQIQEMFSFINKEEETYSEKGLWPVLPDVTLACHAHYSMSSSSFNVQYEDFLIHRDKFFLGLGS